MSIPRLCEYNNTILTRDSSLAVTPKLLPSNSNILFICAKNWI